MDNAFHLHTANRLEDLAEGLAELLEQSPPGDPFTRLEITVAHPGMARWLEQRLAERLGVVLNADWPLPGVTVWRLLRAVLGDDLPEQDPLARDRLALRLLQGLHEDELPLPDHLRPNDEPADRAALRCWQIAQALADIFEEYPLYRPDWVRAWDRNDRALPGLPPALAWQADLWRALTAEDTPHILRLIDDGLERLAQAAPDALALPERIILFGIGHLPPLHLDFFVRLARVRPVHMFVLTPSGEWWGDAENRREARQRLLRGESLVHPLLSLWGREARDFIDLLYDPLDSVPTEYHEHFDPSPAGDSALARVQDSLRHLTPDSLRDVPADDSLVIHASHTPLRACQEVIESILEALRQDATLRPRDIAILCLDIDHWAPYLEAAFATLPEAVRARLPHVIVDRSAVHEFPLLHRLLSLLTPLRTRITAGEVRTLLDEPAIRRRFDIDETLLPALDDWLQDSGVRWGLDGSDRERLELPGTDRHSFAHGEARALLGHALPEDEFALFEGIAPQTGIQGDLADAVGGLLLLASRLRHWREQFTHARPIAEWCALLADYLLDLSQPRGDETEQLQPLLDTLANLAADAESLELDLPLPLAAMQAIVEARLDTPRLIEGYLAGSITCCALHPLRNLPFRHIHVLGLDESAFPRRDRRSALDAIAASPRRGDRSPADDDRQMLLETLLAARDALHLHYQYRDPRNDAHLPPSAPLAELVELLDGLPPEDFEDSPRLRRHPLQPFSPQRYSKQARPLASDPVWHRLATRLAGPARTPALLDDVPLPESPLPDAVDLSWLARILENAPLALLHQRLGIPQAQATAALEDAEPLGTPDALQAWQILDRLHQAAFTGGPVDDRLLARLRAEPRLPEGGAGDALWKEKQDQWAALAEALPDWGFRPPRPFRLALETRQGPLILEGWLKNLYLLDPKGLEDSEALGLLHLRTGKLKPKTWLAASLELLAAVAAGQPVQEAAILHLQGEEATRHELPCGQSVDEAQARLSLLADLALAARDEPAPLLIDAAWKWRETEPDRRETKIRQLWWKKYDETGDWKWPGRERWAQIWGEVDSPFDIPGFADCTACLAELLDLAKGIETGHART